jgi:hypothetical protein
LNDQAVVIKENAEECEGVAIYKFNHVFNAQASQNDVYEKIRPCVDSVLQGINSTIFAYG